MRRYLLASWLAVAACGAAGTDPVSVSGGDAGGDAHKHGFVDFDSGEVAVTGPSTLSGTGLYADFATRAVAPGITTYTPRYELWSDGEKKQRYLYLPPMTRIDTANMDDWVFPVGTKAWKEFHVDGKLIETRMLWKVRADAWFYVSYVWLADGTDAIATPSGLKNAMGTTHDVPSREQCDACHGNVTDTLIGVSALQLSGGPTGTLSTLSAQGWLTQAPSADFEVPGQGVTKEALGYLHGNCGHCHNNTTRMKEQTALRLDVHLTDLTPAQTGAQRTAPGLVMRHLLPPNVTLAVVAGDPSQSGLWLRMQRRADNWEMPPLSTKVRDPAGEAAVGAWITGLK